MIHTEFSHLTTEEVIHMVMSRPASHSLLEFELAQRLADALDELKERKE